MNRPKLSIKNTVIDKATMRIDYEKFSKAQSEYIDWLESNFKPSNYVKSDQFGNIYKAEDGSACIKCKYLNSNQEFCDDCAKNTEIDEYYK
jgi:hypothetical protein